MFIIIIIIINPLHILSEFNSEEYENWSTFAEANAKKITVTYFFSDTQCMLFALTDGL